MAEIDWDALASEATDILQRYIRLDTSNPPGNEELAADFLAGILQAEGIESRKLVAAPGRASLIRQNGGKKVQMRVNLNDILSDPAKYEDLPLKPGDVVVVPERLF